MADESIAPKPMMVLGDALRPISRKMEKRMLEVPAGREWRGDTLEFVLRHLKRIKSDLRALTDKLNGDLRSAVAADGDDAAIWRAAGRFEICIERLLDSYDEARGLKGDARDATGFSLLGDSYRELLDETRAWMSEILDFVDDPIETLRKRGLAPEGDIHLSFRLDLDAPPQFDSLLSWGTQRAEEGSWPGWDYSDDPPGNAVNHGGRRRRDYGGLALVLGAVGLGWLMGDDDG